ncbi:MAG: hypothetical protein ACRCT7_04980 [Shewanella sp.]
MLLKLFFTAVVIACVWFMLTRRRNVVVTTSETPILTSQALLRKYMLTASLGVVLVAGMCAGAWHWLEQQRVLLVSIQSPTETTVKEYRVRKGDIQGNRMVTIDGLQVRFSTEDRVIISPL